MSAEERALRAIMVTRSVISRALNDPDLLMRMFVEDVDLEKLEMYTEELLEYLEKTEPDPG